MMDDEEKQSCPAGAPAWMATFADLATLLLTFFILLLTFAEMDIEKFRDALGSIQQALGFMPSGTGMMQHTSKPSFLEPPRPRSMEEDINRRIEDELRKLVKKHGLQNQVSVIRSKRGVILRVKGRFFFSPGTAELKPESHTILEKIAELMDKFPRKVAIEGHTDNIPISNGKYSSNWELSTARAISALKFLQEKEGIDVKNINIAGFADTRPIASNNTPEGRAQNRRVEFVFYEE